MTSATPLRRDLREVLVALDIVNAEFLFHAQRLREITDGAPEEIEHLHALARGYLNAERHGAILSKYLAARVVRRES